MGKYIDSEKLIAEIERFSATEYGGITLEDDVANGALDYVIEDIIPSLQQEQPEVDLEKDIDKFLKSEESTTYENAGSYKVAVKDPKKIARHFYELGFNARVAQPDYTYNSKEFLEKKIEELQKEVAVLEKQKRNNEILEKIDEYIDKNTCNAHDMSDSNPKKEYCRGVDDTLSNIAGILSGEVTPQMANKAADGMLREERKVSKVVAFGTNAHAYGKYGSIEGVEEKPTKI